MKIVLSRKGFDSSSGGVASPILPDGTMLSLPIPDATSSVRYGDLHHGTLSVGDIVEDLTGGEVTRADTVHLDPDLRAGMLHRLSGWRPLFGQAGAAQSHLAGVGVAPGDLFLFFGWFRRTELVDGTYRCAKDAADIHVLFGWLQVAYVANIEDEACHIPGWASYHPHLGGGARRNNTVYVSREMLEVDGVSLGVSGAGAFERYSPQLCLTAPGRSRSVWRLPSWFLALEPPSLTYNQDIRRWALEDGHSILRSASRGQEFVLDTDDYPDASNWARELVLGGEHAA